MKAADTTVCREFSDRYEVEMKIDNKQQKINLNVEFGSDDDNNNELIRTRVKLRVSGKQNRFASILDFIKISLLLGCMKVVLLSNHSLAPKSRYFITVL